MMSKSRLNHQEKAGIAFFWSNLRLKIESALFPLLILFLPTQLGKHFWPDFAIVSGIRVDYLSPTFYFTDFLIILLFGFWLARDSDKFKLENFVKKNWVLIFFILFLLFNLWFSGNVLNGLYHFLKLVEFCFLGYYIATVIKTNQQVTKLARWLSIGLIFESVVAIAQFIKQASVGGVFYFFGERLFDGTTSGIANASINGSLMLRPYGTFPHPNVLAGFLLISLLFVFFTLKEQKELWSKRLATIAILLGSSALVLTLSRVANILWLFILLSTFLSQIGLFISGQKKKIIIFLGLIIFILFALWLSPLGSRLLQTSLTEESFVQRKELIAASAKLFVAHPFWGVGFGNFIPSVPSVQKVTVATFYLQPVHNIFLLVLTETGPVGLLFFVWLLVKTYRRLFRLIKKRKAAAPVCRLSIILLTIVLILGSFDHYFLTLQQGQLLMTLVTGLAWVKAEGKFE